MQASPSMAAPAIRRPRASPPTQATRRLRAARRCPTTSTPQPPRLHTAAATRLRAPTSSRPRPRRPRSNRALQAMRSRASRRSRTPNIPCLRLRLSQPSLLLQHPLHLNPTRCARFPSGCLCTAHRYRPLRAIYSAYVDPPGIPMCQLLKMNSFYLEVLSRELISKSDLTGAGDCAGKLI